MWERISEAPQAWHARSCVGEDVTARLLALANISSTTAGAVEPGAAIIHRIAAQDDPAVRLVRKRMATRAGLPLTRSEPLFVLEYRPGMSCDRGQAMPHHDWNCAEGSPDDPTDAAVGCSELRLVTSLLYLNDVPPEWGGSTRLPRAGVQVPARRGSCLLWYNARRRAGGGWLKEERAQHFGQCLRAPEGVSGRDARKLVAVQWLQASDLAAVGDDECEEDPEWCEDVEAARHAAAADAEEALLGAVKAEL